MSNQQTDEQERRIEELLDVQAGGVTAGIFGREFCELCGRLGSFSGFIGAMAAHPDGRRYLCGSCRKGESEASRNRDPEVSRSTSRSSSADTAFATPAA